MSENESSVFYLLSNRTTILVLAFVGGFVDAAGYVQLFGLFTSSITGNLIIACTAGLKDGGGVFTRLFITGAFAFGAFLTTMYFFRLKYKLKMDKWEIGILLFSLEAIALFVATVCGISLEYWSGESPTLGSWQTILVGSLLAISMGVHNAAAQDVIPNCPATTSMTMTVVKASMLAAKSFQFFLASRGVNYVCDSIDEAVIKESYNESQRKLQDHLLQILLFVIGAVVGVALAMFIDFWSICVPIVLVVLIVDSIRLSKCEHDRAIEQARTIELNDDIGNSQEADGLNNV